MLHGNALIYQLLLPKITELQALLQPDLRTDSVDVLPLVTYTARGGAALNDGGTAPPMAWSWTLDLSFFHRDEDLVVELSGQVYDFVHTWNDHYATPRTGMVPGFGWADNVRDRAAPSLVAETDLPGHHVTQYAAGFDLNLHQSRRPTPREP